MFVTRALRDIGESHELLPPTPDRRPRGHVHFQKHLVVLAGMLGAHHHRAACGGGAGSGAGPVKDNLLTLALIGLGAVIWYYFIQPVVNFIF